MNSLYYSLAQSLRLNVNFSALISMGSTSELPTPVKHHTGLSSAPSGKPWCTSQSTAMQQPDFLAVSANKIKITSFCSFTFPSSGTVSSQLGTLEPRCNPSQQMDIDSMDRKWRHFFSCSCSVQKAPLASETHTKTSWAFLCACRLIKLNQVHPLMKKLVFNSYVVAVHVSLRSAFLHLTKPQKIFYIDNLPATNPVLTQIIYGHLISVISLPRVFKSRNGTEGTRCLYNKF